MAAQRTRREPCLVIPPRVTLASDSRWRGVSPAQRAQLVGRWEALDLADLGDEDRTEDRAHALDGLDGVVAEVVAEPARDLTSTPSISAS